MKIQIVSRLLFIVAIVGLVIFINPSNNTITMDSSDLVNDLVDAGIGGSESQIDADLLTHRTLIITTDINAISAQKTIKGLLLLNAIDSATPIDLYIRTEGGWVSDAFTIIDVMESISAPVNTHAVGGTFSAGAMILSAGTGTRYGYTYSDVMFHAGQYDDDDQYSVDKLDNERLMKFWKRHANIPTEWLTAEDEERLHLTSEEALEWGMIDQIKITAKHHMDFTVKTPVD